MPDLTSLSGLLKEFGPLGLALIMMGAGLIYLLKWLRSEQDRAEKERKESHDKFATTLDKLTERYERIADKMAASLQKQAERIDALSERVNTLDDHVRDLRP
jgi:hypothetical protein